MNIVAIIYHEDLTSRNGFVKVFPGLRNRAMELLKLRNFSQRTASQHVASDFYVTQRL
jgi:hypothetical protein